MIVLLHSPLDEDWDQVVGVFDCPDKADAALVYHARTNYPDHIGGDNADDVMKQACEHSIPYSFVEGVGLNVVGIGEPKWFFVTGRISGDDEDSCKKVMAVTEDLASDAFVNMLSETRKELNPEMDEEELDDALPIYVNYVIECGDTEPNVISSPN